MYQVPCAYCSWHDKPFDMVTEHEQETCFDEGWNCDECPYFVEEGEVVLD